MEAKKYGTLTEDDHVSNDRDAAFLQRGFNPFEGGPEPQDVRICSICKVDLFGLAQEQEHIAGKKHCKKVRALHRKARKGIKVLMRGQRICKKDRAEGNMN